MSEFKIKDIIKIVDSHGASTGSKGDTGEVIDIDKNEIGDLVTVILLSGRDTGTECTRYHFRYRKVDLDWDE